MGRDGGFGNRFLSYENILNIFERRFKRGYFEGLGVTSYLSLLLWIPFSIGVRVRCLMMVPNDYH